MAQTKFTDQMRDMCDNWNLSRDSALLENLEKISENVIRESEELLHSVKELEFDVNKTAISISTCRNSLQALSDTLFIENKIEEMEELENSSESVEAKNTNHNMMGDPDIMSSSAETVKKSLLIGISILDSHFDAIPMNRNALDTEDTSHNVDVILKAQNPFMERPTPYLIGSTDFFGDSTVGILDPSHQDIGKNEMPSPETPSPKNEQVPSESQISEPSVTSATSLSYPHPSYEPAEPIIQSTPVSFQDQLSARLHSIANNDPELTHRLIGKVGPPQLFASSGSTSEDESSSLFDARTPPSLSIHQTAPIVSPTSNIHVQDHSESDIVNTLPKKLVSDKAITSSILNEMLSKKLLENNSSKTKTATVSTKYEPEDDPPTLFVDNDSILPKPPKQTNASQKPVKSSLAKSLFESSSDEDEPIPNWIPSNNRNQTKLYDSDQESKEKSVPKNVINPVTKLYNEIDRKIITPIEDGDQIVPASKLKNTLTKVLPDMTQAKLLNKSSVIGDSNPNQSLDTSKSIVVPQLNEKKLLPEKAREKPIVNTEVKSIFDDSDDESGKKTLSAKSTSEQTNVIPKLVQNGVHNQPKKKVLSLFDDDSDDDVITVPPKSVPTKPDIHEINSNATDMHGKNVSSQSVILSTSPVEILSDDLFSESPHDEPKSAPKPIRTSNNKTKVTSARPDLSNVSSKKGVDNILNPNSKGRNKPAMFLFSDSDSEDDLFAIPKFKSKTNTIVSTVNKTNSDNQILSDHSNMEVNQVPSITKISNNMSHTAPNKSELLNTSNKPEDFDAPQFLKSTENISEKNFTSTSSSLFSDEDDNINSENKLPSPNFQEFSKEDSNQLSAGTNCKNSSPVKQSISKSSKGLVNEFSNKKPFQSNENKITGDKKTLNELFKSEDKFDLFKSDKQNSLGNKSVNLFNSQDSENSDDDLWKNVPKTKKVPEKLQSEKITDNVIKNNVTDKNSSSNQVPLPEDQVLKTDNEKKNHLIEISNQKITKGGTEKEEKTFIKTKSKPTETFSVRSDKTKTVNPTSIEDDLENSVDSFSIEENPTSDPTHLHSKETSHEEENKSTTEENSSPLFPKDPSNNEEDHLFSKDATEIENSSVTKEPNNDIAEIKKTLTLFENYSSKSDKDVPVSTSKVAGLVNSYSLSSESEPSSPLFPEDKSVRSVKVTTEAKIITKTDKDNPDGVVSSVLKKPEKLTRPKLNLNVLGLLPHQIVSKKAIDAHIEEEKEQKINSNHTLVSEVSPKPGPSVDSESSSTSQQKESNVIDTETSNSTNSTFLPSLTKGRVKMINRKPPSKLLSMRSSRAEHVSLDGNEKNEANETKPIHVEKSDPINTANTGADSKFDEEIDPKPSQIEKCSPILPVNTLAGGIVHEEIVANPILIAKSTSVKTSTGGDIRNDVKRVDPVKNVGDKKGGLFGDDSDDDLFESLSKKIKPVKNKNKINKNKDNLFNETSDEDDDLFKPSQSKGIVKSAQKQGSKETMKGEKTTKKEKILDPLSN